MKLICIVGGRPNIIKVYPLFKEIAKHPEDQGIIIHTGQHYDYRLSEVFFRELNIPKPNEHLGVGSDTHARQTGKILLRIEKFLEKYNPDVVLVFGDMNSSLAGALAAAKMHIPLVHVQAGCRSFDKFAPEEINRTAIDHMSDILFPEAHHDALNLMMEGIPCDKIHMVGNVVIDALKTVLPLVQRSDALGRMNLNPDNYCVTTIHREENTNNIHRLIQIIKGLKLVSNFIRILFPIHPRTKRRLIETGLLNQLIMNKNIILSDPLGYIDFTNCLKNSRFIITDSGGVQEESVVLRKPCITTRNNCELYDSLNFNNFLVGSDHKRIVELSRKLTFDDNMYKEIISRSNPYSYWDGRASPRILNIIKEKFHQKALIIESSDFRPEGPNGYVLTNFHKKKTFQLADYHNSGLRVIVGYDRKGVPVPMCDKKIPKQIKILLRGSMAKLEALRLKKERNKQ